MKLAVIGATGLVGKVILKVLEERNFPVNELFPVASAKSFGNAVLFNNKTYKLIGINDSIKRIPDIAIFSAGSEISLKYATEFEKVGTTVIDNSSAWRMHEHIPLIVPEINASMLMRSEKIIANPNCSTIQLVMALAPLHEKFKIKRIVASTYQSVTGSGMKGKTQLENERIGQETEKAYPHPIDLNVLPHGGDFEDNGYTTEETKLIFETRKILGDSSIGFTGTVVRVPVYGGHSISANVEFHNEFEINKIFELLNNFKGITVQDNPGNNIYPMPINAEGKDDVFVGRIRKDESQPKTMNIWIVADNLRKGAATNAVQIAEYLVKNNLV